VSSSERLLAAPDRPDLAYTLDELFEHAPCGYLTLSASGSVLVVNETLLGWSGRRREQVVGLPVTRLLTPASRLVWETQVAAQLALTGAVRAIALELAGPVPRTSRAVLLSADLRSVGTGGAEVVRAVVYDSAERAKYEQELLSARRRAERTEQRIATLHRVVAGLAAATDPGELAQALVAALGETTGAAACTVWFTGRDQPDLHRAAGSRPPDDLAPAQVALTSATLPALSARTGDVVAVESPEHCARTHPELASALTDCRMQAALTVPLVQDGTVLGCYSVSFVRARTFSDDEQDLHRTLARHITEALQRVTLQEELGRLALHDALTGLPNRSLFTDRLERARARPSRSCCSTSTASSGSTTASGTGRVTRCWWRSRAGPAPPCAAPTPSRGSAVTSSPCCARG
jgi:hypothetical protein